MEAESLLIGMAQIAITIAGFAAVAGSLAARNQEGRLDADRLVIMLIYSMFALIAALAPISLSLFGVSEEWVWRGSAMFILACCAVFAPAQVRRTIRARKHGLPLRMILSSFSLFLAGVTAYALCALNIPAGRLVATYFLGLYIGLVLSVVLLFRIVFSMLRPARPD
ncbi:MAG TPA: hypothetical protein VGO52_22255 [Hyphomonadaceae bacterium]|jgi:hypothetical protein|nr:hypothetical protein [Hyphomonadaceae bacterium]